MTRKDYELIAKALKTARGSVKDEFAIHHDIAAYSLANALRNTNDRFDHGRFLAACGVEA